jgi:hypothetical protein
MKSETYSCLKMLESLLSSVVNAYKLSNWDSADELGNEYRRILDLLRSSLSREQIKYLPWVDTLSYTSLDIKKKSYILEVDRACRIAISYLESLDMDVDKELKAKKEQLTQKEQELNLRIKENDMLKKMLDGYLEATKRLPELARSKIVEETKKSHREIEKNSKQ